jgi:hypothetical protein
MESLESLGRALKQHAVWRASYHQEYVPAGMTMGEQESGMVWVSWPDRALFRFGEPVVRVMGLDGRNVRLVDLEVASCDDHELSDDEWARIPLAAVLDPRGAVDRFVVLVLGERGFALEPREPGGVQRVEVSLGDDNLPRVLTIVDPQGSTNTLSFLAWQGTDTPPEDGWIPKPPATVRCEGHQDD